MSLMQKVRGNLPRGVGTYSDDNYKKVTPPTFNNLLIKSEVRYYPGKKFRQ